MVGMLVLHVWLGSADILSPRFTRVITLHDDCNEFNYYGYKTQFDVKEIEWLRAVFRFYGKGDPLPENMSFCQLADQPLSDREMIGLKRSEAFVAFVGDKIIKNIETLQQARRALTPLKKLLIADPQKWNYDVLIKNLVFVMYQDAAAQLLGSIVQTFNLRVEKDAVTCD